MPGPDPRTSGRGHCSSGQLVTCGEALGGEVGQLVLVPCHPHPGGGERVECAVVLDEGLCDSVYGTGGVGGGSVRVGHALHPNGGGGQHG